MTAIQDFRLNIIHNRHVEVVFAVALEILVSSSQLGSNILILEVCWVQKFQV